MWKIKYLLLLLLTACSNDKDTSTFWGKTDYFSDFLFYKYEPVRMSKKILLDFNEDALELKDIQFGLYEKNQDGEYKSVKNTVRLYKNDSLCKSNILMINGNENEFILGIEFTPEAREGIHKWFLKTLNSGGLDRINEYDFSDDPLPLLLEWRAENNKITNPLKLILNWILVIIAVLILIWIFVIRTQLYPTFKPVKLYLTYPQVQQPVNLRGNYKIICTNKRKNQSLLNRIFVGRIEYVVNDFWDKEVEITPRDKKSIKIRPLNKEYQVSSSTLIKNQNSTLIKKNSDEKVIFKLI